MFTRFFRTVLTVAVVAGMSGSLSGCMGAGGNQFQTTVYDTYRRAANLDRNLQSSVKQLNETTATLLTRVDESDQGLQNVQGILEENQNKLGSLEKKLDSLTNIIYREQGRTLLPGSTSIGPPVAQPPIEQPPSTPGVGDVGVGTPGNVNVGMGNAGPTRNEPPVMPPAPVAPTVNVGPGPAEPLPAPQPLESVGTVPPPAAPAAMAPAPGETPEIAYESAQKKYVRADYQGALDDYTAFLQKFPLAPQAQDAQFWRAKAYQSMNQYEQAIAEYKKLRDEFPVAAGDNAAKSKVPSAMHQQAVCHARLGQTERAIELFKQVIKDYPSSPAAARATEDLQHIQ